VTPDHGGVWVTNTTGFDVYFAGNGSVVDSNDINGEHVELYGDFSSRPKQWSDPLFKLLPPKGTVPYRNVPISMKEPHRPWQSSGFNSIMMFNACNTQPFCNERSVPAYQVVN
jgi:hypothetical protein